MDNEDFDGFVAVARVPGVESSVGTDHETRSGDEELAPAKLVPIAFTLIRDLIHH